jgi:hypothetical protein
MKYSIYGLTAFNESRPDLIDGLRKTHTESRNNTPAIMNGSVSDNVLDHVTTYSIEKSAQIIVLVSYALGASK